MKTSYLFLFLILPVLMLGQDFATNLYGFKLGQFRNVPLTVFGSILQQDKFDDGFEYEVFLVEPDTSVYMTFEYSNNNLKTIWSMQITGSKTGYDCGFRGLKIGMSENDVIKILGKPNSIEEAGEYGNIWEYENVNFNIEINHNKKLAGVKVMDLSYELLPKADSSFFTDFHRYFEIIETNDPSKVSAILAPDIEIYKDSETYSFSTPFEKEIKTDKSKIFSLLDDLSKIISQVNFSDTSQYEENIRLVHQQDIMMVAKFNVKGQYSEVVVKYMFGKYLIWEVKLN